MFVICLVCWCLYLFGEAVIALNRTGFRKQSAESVPKRREDENKEKEKEKEKDKLSRKREEAVASPPAPRSKPFKWKKVRGLLHSSLAIQSCYLICNM